MIGHANAADQKRASAGGSAASTTRFTRRVGTPPPSQPAPGPATVVSPDSMQLGAVGLTLSVLGDTEQSDKIVLVLVVLLDPGSGHDRELGGAVGLLDVDEPGRARGAR